MSIRIKILRSATFALLVLGGVLGSPGSVNAYTAADIDANIPDSRNRVVFEETECENRLNASRADGGTPRSNVNQSNPYPKPSWISLRGNRAVDTVTATWGSTAPIALQSNQLIFICAILVQPVQNSDSFVDRSTIVTYGNFPNDRAPDNASPINNAALQGVSTRINSAAVVAGGGSISNMTGAVFNIPRDPASRYWFSTPVPFDYSPDGPMTSRTVTIEFNVTMISTYTGGVMQCGPPLTNVAAGEFFRCPSVTYQVTFGVSAPEPLVVSCGSVNSLDGSPEIGTDVQLAATINYTGTGGATTFTPTTPSMTVTDPTGVTQAVTGLVVNPATSGSSPGSFTLTATYRPTIPGSYVIRWTSGVNGIAPTPSGTCGGIAGAPTNTFTATLHPYFEVNAGDVLAGAAFSTSPVTPCAASPAPHNPRAGIVSWNNSVSPTFAGAGIDYAAFALDYIQDIATSRANAAPAATALSFSNVSSGAPGSVAPGSGLFGGMFGSIANCVDYWGLKPPDAKLRPWAGGNVNGTATGIYFYNNNLTLNGGNIGNSRRITLYVKGDVNITGDVKYNGSNGWSRPDLIPSFTLVVNGRIFIDESVKQLDGIYVAIPDAAADYGNPAKPRDSFTNPRKGTILTCAAGFSGYAAPALAADSALCDGNGNPLTVNGSFVAAQLFLLRTLGTVSSNIPAEVFNNSPEAWLAPSDSNPIGTEYDSVIGLPPVL